MSPSRLRASVSRMQGYVPGEQPRDPKIIKLNTNENPYPPSPRVQEALRHFKAETLRRYPDPVSSRLREAIARLHGASPDQVLVGNGSDEVLALAVRALVERSGRVGYFVPSYSLYPVLAAIEELRPYEVPLTPAFGWVDPDPAAADLFLITHPNAPTSLAHPRSLVEAFCRASAGNVLIDEAYADFAQEHFMGLAATCDNVLVTRTFSKSYGLAGLRVGYAVGPTALIAAMHKLKDSYNLDALSQALALAAIEDQDYMRTQAARILATRDRMAAALRERGFHVADSQTNFLWVRPTTMDAAAWFQLLREKGVLVRYFREPAVKDHLRITIGDEGAMDALLLVVEEILGL